MTRRLRNKPKELARALLMELVGKENLINMCALGRSKKQTAVPDNIRFAIQCKSIKNILNISKLSINILPIISQFFKPTINVYNNK